MIGMHEHDGYAPHSHEVRADHLGVKLQPGAASDLIIPWSEVCEGDSVVVGQFEMLILGRFSRRSRHG